MRGSKKKALCRRFEAETGREPSSAVLRVMKNGLSPTAAVSAVLVRNSAGHRVGGPGHDSSLHRVFIPPAEHAEPVFTPPEVVIP